MTLPLYLTTDLQADYFLNKAANTLLTPVRYLWGGRVVQLIDGQVKSPQESQYEKTWYKTAFMVAALVPGVLLGLVARGLCIFIEEVDNGFTNLQRGVFAVAPPPPQPVIPEKPEHLPLSRVVERAIDFFTKLTEAPKEQVPTLLAEMDMDYFETALFLKETTVQYDDVPEMLLVRLIPLYNRAYELKVMQNVKDSVSVSSVSSSERKKMKVAESIKVLSILKQTLTPQLFERYCKELNIDFANAKESVRKHVAGIQEAERKALYSRQASRSNELLCLLSDQRDEHVAEWLKEKASKRDYPFPFYHGRKCDIQQKEYKEYFVYEFARKEFKDRYDEAAKRLKRLGLGDWLNESPQAVTKSTK